jgi:hypothetical protein
MFYQFDQNNTGGSFDVNDKVCQIYLEVKGKKRLLHYCREQCKLEYYDRKETIKICSKILEL